MDDPRDRTMDQGTDPDLLLEFPCHYEFKAFGPADTAFTEAVKQAVRKVLPVAEDAVRVRSSSGGRYHSISIAVYLHNSGQLKQIYASLKKVDGLKYLL